MSIRVRRRPPRGLARAWIARAALAVLLPPLALLALERTVRAIDPGGISGEIDVARYRALCEPAPAPRLARHRPGASAELSGTELRFDGRGARGPERATPKPARTRRIVVLGDEVVLGLGVEERETFVALLEDLLTRDTGETWEAVNLGHAGYDAAAALAALEESAAHYEPDAVVLVTGPRSPLRPQALEPDPGAKACALGACLARRLPYLHALAAGRDRGEDRADASDAPAEDPTAADAVPALRARARALDASLYVLDRGASAELERVCADEGAAYARIGITPDERAGGATERDAAGQRILARNVRARLLELGQG